MKTAEKQLRHPQQKRGLWWRGLLCTSIPFVALCHADDLVEFRNCKLIETKWADGDSFLVRSPERGEFTLKLYGADCMEWHVTDPSLPAERRLQRNEEQEAELAFDDRNFRGGETITPIPRPGIGEVLANRIIEGRPYTKIEDLQGVIGPAKFEKARPDLELPDGKNIQQAPAIQTPKDS